MNRITEYVKTVAAGIESRELPAEKLAEISTELNMSVGEFCRLQELKSVAAGSGLTMSEANTVYQLLSESPAGFNKTASLAVKVTMTHLFAVLLQWSHGDTSKPIEFTAIVS